jgi:hypothetical protein
MAAGEAQQVFETQRLSAGMWEERGVSLVGHPDLVVKIGGSLYSWQVRTGLRLWNCDFVVDVHIARTRLRLC